MPGPPILGFPTDYGFFNTSIVKGRSLSKKCLKEILARVNGLQVSIILMDGKLGITLVRIVRVRGS